MADTSTDLVPLKEPDEKRAKKMNIIIEKLESGMWFKDACSMAGINEDTGHRWKKEFTGFADRVEAAIITYKEKLILCVNAGAVKDAKIAIEVLKTRWGEEWNTVKKIEIVDPNKELKRIEDMIYGREDTPTT